ncbi:hypothetical protein K431DRAFT_45817 [Polychaeton citri CBS 116435]|uniref:Uncharacterized protein n=1 Tax=Polychaeton citri CBS 116435 TaxID=1314669 RepID=A0A9P4PVS6_9PEZI|nr:hypothetical protein K431DRAFT_45817 [Polychaeton citri CBS 116435]
MRGRRLQTSKRADSIGSPHKGRSVTALPPAHPHAVNFVAKGGLRNPTITLRSVGGSLVKVSVKWHTIGPRCRTLVQVSLSKHGLGIRLCLTRSHCTSFLAHGSASAAIRCLVSSDKHDMPFILRPHSGPDLPVARHCYRVAGSYVTQMACPACRPHLASGGRVTVLPCWERFHAHASMLMQGRTFRRTSANSWGYWGR